MRKGKVEVHTSVQVRIREIAGLEQFPVLTCIYKWTLVNLLAIFLLNVLFKEFVQANARIYLEVWLNIEKMCSNHVGFIVIQLLVHTNLGKETNITVQRAVVQKL